MSSTHAPESITSISNSSDKSPARAGEFVPLVAILAIVCVAGTVFGALSRLGRKPERLGSAQATPQSILHRDGAWYWQERTKSGGDRLVCAGPTGIQTIATAEAMPSYAVGDGRIAWAARQSHRWTIYLRSSAGSATSARSIWNGNDEPMGLSLSEGHVYWLHHVPAVVLDGAPLPYLSASMEVLAAPLDGGPITSAGRLWEPDDGKVLGSHDGTLYVVAYRRTRPGSTRIYALAPGAPPLRVVGESGWPPALLTHDGNLYWLAASLETADALCLRRFNSNKESDGPELLTDWLPLQCQLFDTSQGVICGGPRDGIPVLWPAGRHDVFPEALSVPSDYVALAAGEHEILLTLKDGSLTAPALFQLRM